jgi:hypothetical protein
MDIKQKGAVVEWSARHAQNKVILLSYALPRGHKMKYLPYCSQEATWVIQTSHPIDQKQPESISKKLLISHENDRLSEAYVVDP